MRNIFKTIMAGTLIMACTVSAQSESVESIMKELRGLTAPVQATVVAPVEPAIAVVVPEAPVVAVVVPEAPVEAVVEPEAPVEATIEPEKSSRGWAFWRRSRADEAVPAESEAVVENTESGMGSQPEIPEAVIEALDVPATLAASQELYVSGEFEHAQRGFEAVIKKDPENRIARMYLRRILDRDPRAVEVQAMKGVRDEWQTDLVLRSYSIAAEAAEKMRLEKVTDSADVTMRFPEVDFPKGSSAVYQPRMGRLFVRNTRENLLVLEEILAALDVAKLSAGVEQVEIEAKFVEVSEGTLEELGFNWNNMRNRGNSGPDIRSGIEGGDVVISGNQDLFSNTLRTVPFDQPGAIGAPVNMDEMPATGDWRAFRFEDTFNNTAASLRLEHSGSTAVDILIRALDQSTGTDVLSAPRIVTSTGKKATIRVGQLHYYPEVYEVGGNEGNIIHVKYQDFAEKLLGVELDVTPRVDGDQISMTLNPKVSELLGMQKYQIAPAHSAYTYFQFRINQQFNHDPIVATLPIFKRREIKTEVTIADGATMGMGGLINERIEKFNDRVPFLGSLPLVGRLFRSEGERAVKRNLMIFVTAKKVEPTGRINTARSFE